MITSINQINFGHKLKTIFLENQNQWQNVSTDKRPSLNILSRFYSTMASQLKKSTYLKILPGIILQNLHRKL